MIACVPKMTASAVAVVVCLVSPPAAIQAAPATRGLDDYTVTIWNENDGLFASRIMVLEQDGDGYLWVGTDIGLLRFDGVRFDPLVPRVGPTLPAGEVTALHSARDGSLWIGVAAIPSLARLRNGILETFGDGRGPRGFVSSILEDRSGRIWIGSSGGLWWVNGDRLEPVPLPVDVGRAVVAVHEDRSARLWVSTRDAVLRRDRDGTTFELIDRVRVSSNAWQRFSEASDGSVWMADFETGFRSAETADPAPPTELRGWGAWLLHDRRGTLWVATRGQGLWRGGGPSGGDEFDVITIDDGLASGAVQCLFEDREGNLWVGTHGGLHRLTRHKVTPLNDLPLARAMATAPDGSVWVGSTTGLTRISSQGRKRYAEAEGMPGSVVLAMHGQDDGSLWLTTERGVARFANGRFSPSLAAPGATLGRAFSLAWHDDSVWMRDVDFRLGRVSDRGESLATDGVPPAYTRSTTALETDSRGRLWIGTLSGRAGVRSPGGAFESFATGIGIVNAIFEDAAQSIWFGGEGGVARLEDGEMAVVSTRQGLGPVRALVEDDEGAMWVGLTSGIARVDKAEFVRAAAAKDGPVRYRLFNSADGAAGRPVTLGSRTAVRARDGRIWFATSGGVTVVDPRSIGSPRPEVPARVEDIIADGRRIRDADVRLEPGAAHVQVEFTALTMTDATRVQFQYRLDGFDTGWVHSGTVRQATYTNLRPGQYRFRVRATNSDGVWGPPDTRAFAVAPAFYQTGWFYAGGVLGLCAVVAAGWQLHVRRVRRQFALVLAERIRMSRAIHDTLLQGLAGLALQLDDVSHGLEGVSPLRDRLRAMRERVEDSIRDARQSIWDLRHPRPARQPLAGALHEAAARTVAHRPVQLEVTVHGTELQRSDAVEEQLLLICQEAVSNAVTHGRASRIGIELTYCHDGLRLRIEDDGCGFDEMALAGTGSHPGHYGMLSMRERAAAAGGHAAVVSSPGAGTIVHVTVPRS